MPNKRAKWRRDEWSSRTATGWTARSTRPRYTNPNDTYHKKDGTVITVPFFFCALPSTMHLVLERLQFGAACHMLDELLDGKFRALCVELHAPQIKHGEMIADQIRVVRIVADEYDAKSGIPCRRDVFQDDARLFDAQGRRRLVE